MKCYYTAIISFFFREIPKYYCGAMKACMCSFTVLLLWSVQSVFERTAANVSIYLWKHRNTFRVCIYFVHILYNKLN